MPKALVFLSLPSNSGLVNLKLPVASLFSSLPGYSHVCCIILEPMKILLLCIGILVMVLMTRGLAGSHATFPCTVLL